MSNLLDILNEKEGRYSSVPTLLVNKTIGVQSDLYAELMRLINELERDGDTILLTESNLQKIDLISEKLIHFTFTETEYTAALTAFAKEFNTQGELNDRLMREIQEDFEAKQIYKSVLRQSQVKSIELMANSAVRNIYVNPVVDILTVSVTTGASLQTTMDSLRQITVGDKEVNGLLERHVKQVAYDAFAVSDRQYLKTISDDLNYQWFQYFGGTIKDSRCFCVTRAGGFFHINEIEHWGETPSEWDKKTGCSHGGGMMKGTNKTTIFSFAGGYRCMHQIVPALERRVPTKWVTRARQKGFIK